MALYRYFNSVSADGVLPCPTGSLASTVSPATIKEANDAVKTVLSSKTQSRGSYTKYTQEQRAMIGDYSAISISGSLSHVLGESGAWLTISAKREIKNRENFF